LAKQNFISQTTHVISQNPSETTSTTGNPSETTSTTGNNRRRSSSTEGNEQHRRLPSPPETPSFTTRASSPSFTSNAVVHFQRRRSLHQRLQTPASSSTLPSFTIQTQQTATCRNQIRFELNFFIIIVL
jgi:hypothetical protein